MNRQEAGANVTVATNSLSSPLARSGSELSSTTGAVSCRAASDARTMYLRARKASEATDDADRAGGIPKSTVSRDDRIVDNIRISIQRIALLPDAQRVMS